MISRTHTSTFADLPVLPSTYADIRGRLVALGRDYVEEYFHDFDKPEERIVLGAVALVVEEPPKPISEAEIENLRHG